MHIELSGQGKIGVFLTREKTSESGETFPNWKDHGQKKGAASSERIPKKNMGGIVS